MRKNNVLNIIVFILVVLSCSLSASFASEDHALITVGSEEYPATSHGLNQAIHDVSDGGTIQLTSDILADNPIYIFGKTTYVRDVKFASQKLENKTFTIEGNGHTIKANYATKSTTATSGQDDWGTRGVLAIAEFGGKVTFKDVTIDANNNTYFGVWAYRTGDGVHKNAKDGVIVLDSVSMMNAKSAYSKGGYGCQVNASTVKAIHPTTSGNSKYGFEVVIGKGLSSDTKSELYIDGVSTFDEVNKYNTKKASGYGKYVNIIAEKKPNITVIDNDVRYQVADYRKNDYFTGKLDPAIINDTYLPETLDTFNYDIHQAEVGGGWFFKAKQFVVFANKPVKIKFDKATKVQDTVYKWDLEKKGTIEQGNIPKYTVNVICKDNEKKYFLTGTIHVQNFSSEKKENVKLDVNVFLKKTEDPLVKKEVFTVASNEEKNINFSFEFDSFEALKTVEKATLMLEADGQYVREVDMPIKETVEHVDVDKEVTVVDDKHSFDPAFTVEWQKDKMYTKEYTLDPISKEVKNTATITLDDESDIVKSVTLIPIPKKTFWLDTEGRTLKHHEEGIKKHGKIDGYIFVETKVDDSLGDVTHIFKEKEKTLTKWVDEAGKELKPSKEGVQEAAKVKGYIFVETKKQPSLLIHVFKKKEVEEKVTTSWVDTKDKKLASDVEGVKPAGEFPGYTFVDTKKDESSVIHVFKKNENTVSKTYWVDLDGKTIKQSEDGVKKHGKVDGYVFVESKKNEQFGDVVHVFKESDVELPKTGSKTNMPIYFLGGVVIVFAVLLIVKSNKKKR